MKRKPDPNVVRALVDDVANLAPKIEPLQALVLATARALQAHLANHRHYRGLELLTPLADELGKSIAAVEAAAPAEDA